MTASVSAAEAAAEFFGGWLNWKLTVGGAELHRNDTAICTKYPITRSATVQDLLEEEPLIRDLKASTEDLERLLDLAHEDIVKKLATPVSGLVFTYVGPEQFRTATVLQALHRRYRRQPGEMAKEMSERYSMLVGQEIQGMLTMQPRDEDGDEIFRESEKKSWRSARIYRG